MYTYNVTNGARFYAIPKLPTAPRSFHITLLLFAIMALGYGFQSQASAQSSSIDLQLLSTSMATDSSGNTYYADTAHSIIYKHSTSGVTTSVNCCAGLSPANLNDPRGVALDTAGDMYIADTGNNRIVEISAAGQFSVVDTQLYQEAMPSGIAVDANDNVYISDTGNNRVLEVDNSGQPTQVITGSYKLSNPLGLAVDQARNLYISDANNNRIIQVTPSGSVATLMSNAVNSPLSIASDQYGNAYIGQLGGANQQASQSSGMPAVVASFNATNINLHQGTGSQIPVSKMTVTLAPQGGFNGTLSLEVLGLPPNVLADFSPLTITLNGNTPVVETIMLGISSQNQNASLTTHGNATHSTGSPNNMPLLACMAPISLLALIGLRGTRKTLGRPLKITGLVVILLLLPAMVAMTSGCAGGYPAGLLGNNTYTATLVAHSTTGNTLYQLGSFGITIQ